MFSLVSLDGRTVEALFILALGAFVGWLLVKDGKWPNVFPSPNVPQQDQGITEVQNIIQADGASFVLAAPGGSSAFNGTPSPGTV